MEDHIVFDAQNAVLDLLDQRKLPTQEERFLCKSVAQVIEALKVMVVRGAPAIGVSAAFGCAIAAREAASKGTEGWEARFESLLDELKAARPTAVNLAWAVERIRGIWKKLGTKDPEELYRTLAKEAEKMRKDDVASCKAMGRFGLECIPDGACIMTHCNAGALATAGYGTALGVIRAAYEAKPGITVIANETRPFLQGARLTAWELHKDGIPVTVACDNACSLLMSKGLVSCVVVGADRIAANGDTANKIGTSGVALIAREHGIPFYVAAPTSTIDMDTKTGADIPIEVRPDSEVRFVGATKIMPDVPVFNFAFDVTPAAHISAIITDKGVLRAPYTESIAKLLKG